MKTNQTADVGTAVFDDKTSSGRRTMECLPESDEDFTHVGRNRLWQNDPS